MRNRAGPLNCCIAQMLLKHKGITTVTPVELSQMLGVNPTTAGFILRHLSWRHERLRANLRAIYHYQGIDVEFTGWVRAQAKKLLARMLGVPIKELVGVPA